MLLKKSVERTKLDIYVFIMRIFKFNLIQKNHFDIFIIFQYSLISSERQKTTMIWYYKCSLFYLPHNIFTFSNIGFWMMHALFKTFHKSWTCWHMFLLLHLSLIKLMNVFTFSSHCSWLLHFVPFGSILTLAIYICCCELHSMSTLWFSQNVFVFIWLAKKK